MIYSILTREKLLNLLSQGLSVSEDANEGDDKMLSLDDLKMQIQQQVAEDPFVTEQAPNVIPWRELSDPEAAFAQCTSPAEVQKIEASITERVNHSKTAIGALRRSIRDRTKIKILPFWNYKRLHIMILIWLYHQSSKSRLLNLHSTTNKGINRLQIHNTHTYYIFLK